MLVLRMPFEEKYYLNQNIRFLFLAFDRFLLGETAEKSFEKLLEYTLDLLVDENFDNTWNIFLFAHLGKLEC